VLPLSEEPLDRDRVLALSYGPARHRAALGALWRLDAALGQAIAGGSEPMIARIKLAWWREALERLDREPPPAEPVLLALAEHVIPSGVSGAELGGMEEGWAALLSPDPLTAEDLGLYASARGRALFELSARILGAGGFDAGPGGEAWALVDLARHCANSADCDSALEAARQRIARERWPAALRPLGMLAALAARDAEPARPHWEESGSPRRMGRMLRHRLTGL
jgi:phytoene synthase